MKDFSIPEYLLSEALLQKYNTYYFFWKHRLSQWHMSNFYVDNELYSCAEQYMMAQKAILFSDIESLNKIMDAKHPREQQKLGRNIKNFDINIWKAHRFEIVVTGNMARFSQNFDDLSILKNTNNTLLVEASPYDIVWGIGMPENDTNIHNPENWQGCNLLGMALTLVKERLINPLKHQQNF